MNGIVFKQVGSHYEFRASERAPKHNLYTTTFGFGWLTHLFHKNVKEKVQVIRNGKIKQKTLYFTKNSINNAFTEEVCSKKPNRKMVKLFIAKGANVNLVDREGRLPLQEAILKKSPDFEFIKLLMDEGADLDLPGLHGWSALQTAIVIKSPNLEVIKLLIDRGANLNLPGDNGLTPLELTISRQSSNLKLIKLLIRAGADVNRPGKHKATPLHRAIWSESPNLALIKLLIREGADLNAVDGSRCTALHLAIEKDSPNLKLIKLLIDRGANLDVQEHFGYTPLHMAISKDSSNLELIKLLIDRGANLNIHEKLDRRTPLQKAIYDEKELKLIQLLIDGGADVNLRRGDGPTPLQLAIYQEASLELIQLLIDAGADVNLPGEHGYTPLHAGIFGKRVSDFMERLFGVDFIRGQWDEKRIQLIQWLIDNGAYKLNKEGQTMSYLIKAIGLTSKDINFDLLHTDPWCDAEYESRFLLANSWSMKTSLEEENPEDGGTFKISEIKQLELFKKFKELFQDFSDFQYLYDLMETNFKSDEEELAEIAKKYANGDTLIFNTGWKRHGIQVIIHKDYLIVCNRGDGRRKPSVKVYKIDRENFPLTEEDLFKIKNHDTWSEEGVQFFYKDLPTRLGYQKSRQDAICKFINRECRQSSQTRGNCWWLSAITGTQGLLLIDALAEIDVDALSKRQLVGELKQKYAERHLICRAYAQFVKLELLKEYLARPDDGEPRDHGLVKQAYKKYYSKRWKYVFGDLESRDEPRFPKLQSQKKIRKLFENYKTEFKLDDNFDPVSAA